jgi:hypothetical protein
MDERERALADIAALAGKHGLTLDDIAGALRREPAGHTRARNVVITVLGVLGGTFVFAGIGVFIALQWDDMNAGARVVVTLGSGVAALVLSLLAARDPRFARAHTPLLLSAAVLQPLGMLVAFDEFGSGGDWRLASLVTSGVMAAQFGALVPTLGRSLPVFLTLLFGLLFWWTALDLVEADGTAIALVLGAGALLASIGVARTRYRDATPFWYFVGGAVFLHGVFEAVERTPFEILFLAVAAGLVYISVLVHSRALLAVATLAILAYTGWFTSEHFADSFGWPLALIAFGIVMIGLSAAAYRIDRDYVRRGAPRAPDARTDR